MVLGLLFSIITHALIEIGYINSRLSQGILPINQAEFGYGYCALPVWLQAMLLIMGIALGYVAGVYFWRVIYIEKRYRKFLRHA